ncbi:MAG: PAS domain S-box protein [Chloroflexi bacterium]|nr:MAG: PAS domain S-box protein [Chloroflexota bacterium]
MSVDQDHMQTLERENDNQVLLEEMAYPQSSKNEQVPTNKRATPFWRVLIRWFLTHNFTPQWLPKPWNHPLVGYIVAVLSQFIAVIVTMLLTQLFPSFTSTGLLEALAVALVALNWGAGPSVIATLAGAALINFIIKVPHFTWSFDATSLVQLLIFFLVGITISIVASQIERARRNAEELAFSLEVERSQLNAIIETVPDALSIHDVHGKIVRLNPAGRRNTGPKRINTAIDDKQRAFGLRTLTGEPFPTKDIPVVRALQGETVSGVEMRFLNAEGQDIYALMSAAPLFDIQGKVDGVVLITHDISALHQAERERALRASELEAAFESITDGVFLFNRDLQIISLNNAARELLAIKNSSDYLSRSANERMAMLVMRDEQGQLLTGEQWPMSRILKGEVLQGPDAADIIVRRLDGRDLELSVSGAPVRNQEGELIGALCICRDVTERRQLEKRTQAALGALLAMAETLVLPGDSPGSKSGALTTVEVNKIAHRIAELTRSVLGCQRVSITSVEPETNMLHHVAVVGLSPDEERQWLADQQQETRLGDGPDPTIATELRANEVLLLDMTQPPFDTQPNPYHIHTLLMAPMTVGEQLVGLLSLDFGGQEHDYSTDEIALAKAVAKLAALAIERDRLLRERADARASELALREANRRMDEFLGMTSHELKTPLTSIKGNTQLTVRQIKNSLSTFQKMQGMLESTERQVKLLDRLVDDLLDISRSQEQLLELSPAPCDLTAIVRETVQEQQYAWPNRTITLDLPAEGTIPVSADADRISQVLRNYLTNALKYSSEEKPVRVSVSKDQENARVSVQDEGTGLFPDEQAKIWERFYRVEGAEVLSNAGSANAGLGLGLYICKAIVEQHHGSVGVESTPGVGSSFWFTLPLASSIESP